MKCEYIELEQNPLEPGIDIMYTIIEEDMRMNPYCPCEARTCPNHGFCKYCVPHHQEINRMLIAEGHPEAIHGPHCKWPEQAPGNMWKGESK